MILLLVLLVIAVIFFFVIRNGKSKTTKKTAKVENSKDKNALDKEIQNISTNNVKIIVWRSMGEDLVAQVGKPIIAEERKDENNNLLVIHEEANFKEDFNFSIDRVYEIMNFSLKLQNKTNREKAIELKKEMKIQEALLIDLDIDIDKNKEFNYRDEEVKLKQLKIFYDSLLKEKKGNYMRLGEGGIRQYEFIAIDGILYPYFFGSKRFRVYPDLTIKKKIFNHENSIFQKETAILQQGILNWIMIVVMGLGILMCGMGGFMMYKGYYKVSDISLQANQGAITCTNTLAQLQSQYGGVIQEYMSAKQTEIQNIKNDEVDINNNAINNAIQGAINIDPSKITR